MDETLDLDTLMEAANVNYAQRDELRRDPERAAALLDHALHKKGVDKPAAYALARFRKGEWPSEPQSSVRGKPRLSAYKRAELMIYGHGWDEDYGTSEMTEDLDRLYARSGQTLPDVTREVLLSLWQAEQLRRYPPEALTAEEWAALDADQLKLLES